MDQKFIDIGRIGESLALRFCKATLKSNQIPHNLMQLDWLVEKGDEVILFEVKTQEKYLNPDGHGLPPKQIKARLSLLKKFNCKARFILLIICLDDNCIYTLEVDEDWERKGFYTKTGKRFIFYLRRFKKHLFKDRAWEDLKKFKDT